MCIFTEISLLKSMKYDIQIHASWMKFWLNDGQWIEFNWNQLYLHDTSRVHPHVFQSLTMCLVDSYCCTPLYTFFKLWFYERVFKYLW